MLRAPRNSLGGDLMRIAGLTGLTLASLAALGLGLGACGGSSAGDDTGDDTTPDATDIGL